MIKRYLLIALVGVFSTLNIFSYNTDHLNMLFERFSPENNLYFVDMDGLDLSEVKIKNSYNFSKIKIRGCNFSNSTVMGANFKFVDFSPTDSISSKVSLLDNQRRRPALRLGLLDKWMKYYKDVSKRLDVNLRGVSSERKSLLDSFPFLDKSRPYLERLKLTDDYQNKFKKQINDLRIRVIYVPKKIINTSFVGANINCGNFTGANCRDVDFTNASLIGCLFTGTNLAGAIFKDAVLMNTAADNGTDKDWFADFRGAFGLTQEQKLDLWNRGALVDLSEDQKIFFTGIAGELKQYQKNYLGII